MKMANKQYCEYSDNYQCEKIVINDEFTEIIQISIDKTIKKEGYLNYDDTDARKISTGGNNFLGELYEINVKGKTNDGDRETSLFLKHIVYNPDFKVYSISQVYAKEAFAYNELFKMYHILQDTAEIPVGERFKTAKSYDETNEEVIILDNLAKKGFKTMPRRDVMTIEFAELSVKQLAKFHGLSFVLENKDPTYYEEKIKTKKQSFVYDDYWNELVKKMCDISLSRIDEITKEKISKFLIIAEEKYPKYMNGLNSTIRCLCHGDYKMNNVLLKEIDGRVVDVIPIDFQQIYYGCPVMDLLYFIYAASDRNFRKQHLFNLRDIYYETLTSFLKYFNIDIASVVSRVQFEKCFSDSLEYGLMYTLYMLPMFFVADELPDVTTDDLLDVSIRVDERFFDRMQGIVDDFVELGVL